MPRAPCVCPVFHERVACVKFLSDAVLINLYVPGDFFGSYLNGNRDPVRFPEALETSRKTCSQSMFSLEHTQHNSKPGVVATIESTLYIPLA